MVRSDTDANTGGRPVEWWFAVSDSASSVLIAAHRLLLRIWRALLLN
jgi:hypothetical protein